MTTLRWTLGGLIVLLGGGFILLNIVAGGFRKSFGASDVNPLITILPLVAMGLLFAGILFPGSKPLLHAGGVAASAMMGLLLWWTFAESAQITWLGIAYLIAWLTFYWQAAGRTI